MVEFYPQRVKHGWVVAACVVKHDYEPTVFTEKGANDLSRKLNAAKVDVAPLDEHREPGEGGMQ